MTRAVLLLLLITSSAFADDDPYRSVASILKERSENAIEVGTIEIMHLTKDECRGLADNLQIKRKRPFVKGCEGKGVSYLQQVEQPELPKFVDTAIVTYVNYGNVDFAVENPETFFGNGNFYFPGIVAKAHKMTCNNLDTIRDERVEVATRYMVNDLLAYDVRVTYKEMGIVSVRYFLDKESTPFYPQRHDYNFYCD